MKINKVLAAAIAASVVIAPVTAIGGTRASDSDQADGAGGSGIE